MTPKLSKIFPESCLLIVVGVIIGVLLRYATNLHVSPLTPNTFFFYMLPPIILDAGYFMPNRMFFDNIGTILLMAVIGTIFNIATIGEWRERPSSGPSSSIKCVPILIPRRCVAVGVWTDRHFRSGSAIFARIPVLVADFRRRPGGGAGRV